MKRLSMSDDRLPNEIWRHVFDLAVFHPHVYDVEWNYSQDPLWNGWNGTSHEIASTIMPTAVTLVQVSKKWKEMAEEFLYRYLFVGNDQTINRTQLLVQALERTHLTQSMGYGWWTKRLDIPLHLLDEEHISLTLRLLSALHNLEVLVLTHFHMLAPISVVQQFASLCTSRFAHSLRRISFFLGDLWMLDYNGYLACLPQLPLTALTLHVWRPGNSNPDGSLPSPTPPTAFATVTTLILHFRSVIRAFPSHWRFPSLKHLDLMQLGHYDVSATGGFLQINGGHVVSLRVNYTPRLAQLIRHLPELRSLVVQLASTTSQRQFTLLFDPMHLLSELTHIGIMWSVGSYAKLHTLRSGMTALFEKQAWNSVYPGLQVVRIMSEVVFPVNQETGAFWRNVMADCAHNGIRLENGRGGLLAV